MFSQLNEIAATKVGNIYGSGVCSPGLHLDDFQVDDAALSDTEIQALRREFCPDPFFILVK